MTYSGQELIELLNEFMRDAGKHAIENQADARASLKVDQSLVTQIDIELSDMFAQFVQKHFAGQAVCVVDEERSEGRDKVFADMDDADLTLIIDPIDGTRTFFWGMPYWGITIAAFHKRQPVCAVVYLPGLDVMVTSDTKTVTRIQHPFSDRVQTSTVPPMDPENPLPLHCDGRHLRDAYAISPIKLMNCHAVAVNNFYVLTSKAASNFISVSCSLWDIAPCFPFMEPLKLTFYDRERNKAFTTLDPSDYEESCKIKNGWFLMLEGLLGRMLR